VEHDWERLEKFGDAEVIYWLACRRCGDVAWSDEINRTQFDRKECIVRNATEAQPLLTDRDIVRKIMQHIKMWKQSEDGLQDYNEVDCLLDIDDLLEEQGYDTGENPKSWEYIRD
jgi:hypothetical protein